MWTSAHDGVPARTQATASCNDIEAATALSVAVAGRVTRNDKARKPGAMSTTAGSIVGMKGKRDSDGGTGALDTCCCEKSGVQAFASVADQFSQRNSLSNNQNRFTVLLQHAIDCQQNESFRNGLRNQETVNWIMMNIRQTKKNQYAATLDGQFLILIGQRASLQHQQENPGGGVLL